MAKSSKAPAAPSGAAEVDGLVSRSEERLTAYQAAKREIDHLQPGQAIVYHEGHLAVDAARDAVIAGRAAAFLEAATELGQGVLGQRSVRADWYQYVFWRSRR
jgi:hypothetical protein